MKNKDKIRHNYLVEVISSLLLLVIIAFSLFFIYYQKRVQSEKVDEICTAISTGVASISIEAILTEETALITDYIRNIKSRNPIVEKINIYKIPLLTNKNSLEFFISSKPDLQHHLSKERVKELLEIIKPFRKEESKSLIFYYPLTLKVKKDKKEVLIGVAEIFFSKTGLFETYYSYRNFSIFIVVIVVLISSFLIYLYIMINRKLEEKTEMIRMLSLTDELTRIFNRKKINDALKDEINRAKRYKGYFTLIMFDIDHFKRTNDNFGHDVGDSVLKNVVKVVGAQLRITDIFGRWGGEEFIIICPNTTKLDGVALAERIRGSIESFAFPVVKDVSCSFGVTEFIITDSEDSILKRVDDALYEAKEKGRNRVVFY
ncbi:MAG: GGDEF domain-containing protein [Brevinematia bacterium]